MQRWVWLTLGVAVALGCAASPACRLAGGSAKKVTVPGTIAPADGQYTLLYSTVGYESAATKRVLIRQNDADAAPSERLAFLWRLIDASGSQVQAGTAAFAGEAWGIPIWTADFSKARKPGTYRLLVEAPGVQLATDAFPIDEFLLFKSTYAPVALDNAEARAAPIEMDGGFFSGSDRSGSAGAHAEFLVGLLESYERRRASMPEDARERALAAIDRAVDYLFLLSDPASGEIAGQSATRPHGDFDPSTTAAGLRGLAHYAALAKTEQPDKSDRAFRRAKLAETWLLENAPAAYSPALQAAVDYDLYSVAGDRATLDRATAAVRLAVGDYDLRTMDRHFGDALPHFEAMYRMWRDLPTHQDRAFWEETAKAASSQYRDMINRGVFQIIPPGATNAAEGTSAAEQWDKVDSLQLPGEGVDAMIGNDWIMARAIDAVYLSAITGDLTLEKAATAGIEWVTGLNAGVPSQRVVGASGGSPYQAASFLTGLAARQVAPTTDWEWQRPKPFATIVNGFRGAFVFDDRPPAGGTSLHHDGLWLYASAVYEDYVNQGSRAPRLDTTSVFQPGVRAVKAGGVEVGGVPALLVNVAGPDGKGIEGARVTVAWSGAPDPAVHPDQALVLTQCVTAADGSCSAGTELTTLLEPRPLSAAVTNVEHPAYVYDETRAPPPVEFPGAAPQQEVVPAATE